MSKIITLGQKSGIVSGNRLGEIFFLSLTHPHNRMCISEYILLISKNKQAKKNCGRPGEDFSRHPHFRKHKNFLFLCLKLFSLFLKSWISVSLSQTNCMMFYRQNTRKEFLDHFHFLIGICGQERNWSFFFDLLWSNISSYVQWLNQVKTWAGAFSRFLGIYIGVIWWKISMTAT